MPLLLITFCLAAVLGAQTRVMPLSEVRAGMKGKGLTVFSGQKVETFDAEILGVLENAGPRQAVILARLSGGPLAHTGVMQGMSGSPIYIDGKLIGAVALAFSLSKDPIAGIRPFEEMLQPQAPPRPQLARCNTLTCAPQSDPIGWGDVKLTEIATPVSFSGFTPGTLAAFAPELRKFGLEPRQGVSGGGGTSLPQGSASDLQPGSMISVQLVSGDLSIGADGTVTHIDGNRVYAFGHRFISLGDVDLPFASAEVLTLLPNLSTSFKISAARKWLGSITADYSTAVRGEIGRKPKLIPVELRVTGGSRASNYRFDVVQDAALTPFLLQMAVFSAIDATERTVGALTYTVDQTIRFAAAAEVKSQNIFSGEFNIPQLAAQSFAIPLAYAMQSGFPELQISSIDMHIDATPGRKQATIEDLYSTKREARAGDTIPVTILFASDGERTSQTLPFRIPEGTQPGTLQFTVSDGATTNMTEFRTLAFMPPKTPAQVTMLLNALRGNENAYVRIWRAEPSYTSQGHDLPDPPPSVAHLFMRSQGATAAANLTSKIAELQFRAPGKMVSGTKSFSLEVKE